MKLRFLLIPLKEVNSSSHKPMLSGSTVLMKLKHVMLDDMTAAMTARACKQLHKSGCTPFLFGKKKSLNLAKFENATNKHTQQARS